MQILLYSGPGLRYTVLDETGQMAFGRTLATYYKAIVLKLRSEREVRYGLKKSDIIQ